MVAVADTAPVRQAVSCHGPGTKVYALEISECDCWVDSEVYKYFEQNPPQSFFCRKTNCWSNDSVAPQVFLDSSVLPHHFNDKANEDPRLIMDNWLVVRIGIGYVLLATRMITKNAARGFARRMVDNTKRAFVAVLGCSSLSRRNIDQNNVEGYRWKSIALSCRRPYQV